MQNQPRRAALFLGFLCFLVSAPGSQTVTAEDPFPWPYTWGLDQGWYGERRLPGGLVALRAGPSQPARGTVFIAHGFLEHAALQEPLAEPAWARGWVVTALDLPGHGRSAGPRGNISDFAEYGQALETWFNDGADLPRPWVYIGHSTGAAAFLEYAAQRPSVPFEKVVFIAPLVRSWLWDLSGFAIALTGGWIGTVPARADGNSADPAVADRLWRDPLYIKSVPLAWFTALKAWNSRLESYQWPRLPLTVIQGGQDTVVDAAYNVPWLRARFPDLRLLELPGARHGPQVEVEPWRSRFFEIWTGLLAGVEEKTLANRP